LNSQQVAARIACIRLDLEDARIADTADTLAARRQLRPNLLGLRRRERQRAVRHVPQVVAVPVGPHDSG